MTLAAAADGVAALAQGPDGDELLVSAVTGKRGEFWLG
jgi:hypothetical protein